MWIKGAPTLRDRIAEYVFIALGGMTDIYAPYQPDYLGQARKAIDGLFADLDEMTDKSLSRVMEVK